ncbi:carbon-nitrogen hydrolase family protein [Gordonia polyisoprenivorans VH2]|uniref:Carbon-nitrogen hydrolase family protein n=1 Tax=Gordonia polyisoprenivorans (strain DSM 44266 / VH2) TaxID=1112204 RepID=H6MZP2_GORPV|nr:carbon-nitrogen hydrolase family protein [Gordonia polyisoprenivorans]AFA72029.1 carbon-nitrogen hydrolase family protein [Gordonia polyisoprenivorans VH2]QUD81875.1 carbon-nitrogen hydrolase family protein [Gordonia polyisoprenivorans]WCB38413.1 carbon-nitrogen hydrolase family protein [Gordonia polyisoprenivorans]
MRIAMAQITSGTDPDDNLRLVAEHTAAASADGAVLVVFPEATMCRFGVPLGPVAQSLDGPWATGVSQIAVENSVTVIAGMFTPGDDGRVANTLLVAAPDGTRIGYDKIHLYDAFGFRESATVAPGDVARTVTVDGVRIGLATCYDIRFPALFTALAQNGAEVIVVPASWGAGRGKVEQWRTLATARALDSTSYVVAVGQAEPADEELRASKAPTGVGHSQISDPFGSVVASYTGEQRLGVHDLDLGVVAKAREQLAVLANQREFRIEPTPVAYEL